MLLSRLFGSKRASVGAFQANIIQVSKICTYCEMYFILSCPLNGTSEHEVASVLTQQLLQLGSLGLITGNQCFPEFLQGKILIPIFRFM